MSGCKCAFAYLCVVVVNLMKNCLDQKVIFFITLQQGQYVQPTEVRGADPNLTQRSLFVYGAPDTTNQLPRVNTNK